MTQTGGGCLSLYFVQALGWQSIFISLSVENAMWLLKAVPPTKSCFDMPACCSVVIPDVFLHLRLLTRHNG